MDVLADAAEDVAQLQTSSAFRYGVPVSFQRFASTGKAAEAAKRRAFSRFASTQATLQTLTSLSEIVVSTGGGGESNS